MNFSFIQSETSGQTIRFFMSKGIGAVRIKVLSFKTSQFWLKTK